MSTAFQDPRWHQQTREDATLRCQGAGDVRESVAINHHEGVDVSITGNFTNSTRFQHQVAGTYKREYVERGKKYFSVASDGQRRGVPVFPKRPSGQ